MRSLVFALLLAVAAFVFMNVGSTRAPDGVQDVVVMSAAMPSIGSTISIQVDTPAYVETAHEMAVAEPGQTTVEKAHLPSGMTGVAEFHTLQTDKPILATNSARAFHMLTFQDRFSPVVMLEAQSFSTLNGCGTAKEGRAHAPRGVRGFSPRLLS